MLLSHSIYACLQKVLILYLYLYSKILNPVLRRRCRLRRRLRRRHRYISNNLNMITMDLR